MRVPISWLGDWADLPEDVTLEHLHAALVKVGFEEEDVHDFAVTGPIVVGRVLERTPEPQSNGKTINWCQVDVGGDEPRGIVCGAHNFEAGDLVVVSLPGAVLPGPFPISARKTYGHVSDGMIASERELGLGDEHGGILRLADRGLTAEPGDDAIALLGLDDAAVEINVTPDRGYALSIRGIAREYSHSTGARFSDPASEVVVGEADGFPVRLDDAAPIRGRAGCDAFAARVVRGVDATRPSPPWMVSRLRLAGIRSISLPVDITNYVMLELGQPTHAYDLAALRGGIVVRRANPGETVETLDGQVRSLDPEDLLITDDSGAIGLAGVMGGRSTEVTDATTDILVESAHFDPVTVARTARRHKLWSEASKRFERGADPTLGPIAAQRVADLLVAFGGGTIDALGATIVAPPTTITIDLPEGWVDRLIGVDYSADEVTDTLVAIGCAVSATGTGWAVTPPPWRPDLTDRPALAEEVARVVGYDRIPSELPIAPPGRGLTREQRLRRLAGATLASAGLTEVLAYPFLSADENRRFGSVDGAEVPTVSLANALDPNAAVLRTSLIPGLVHVARRNRGRGLNDLALFEIGHVYRPAADQVLGTDELPAPAQRPTGDVLAAMSAGLPAQPWLVGALFSGDAIVRQASQAAVPSGIADALDTARHLAAALGAPLSIVQGEHAAMHPGRTAELRIDDVVIGYAGELRPALAEEADLPRVVAVLELDLDALIAASGEQVGAGSLSGYPAATQDVSLVVPVEVVAGDVVEAIVEGAGAILEDARLTDDYRGSGVPAGAKSLTIALRFRASDRTLTQAEATEAKLAGVAIAAERFGATLRE
jgi:phenylalanyl-tRNA synthetase beta chain